jgi:hypothetical protein
MITRIVKGIILIIFCLMLFPKVILAEEVIPAKDISMSKDNVSQSDRFNVQDFSEPALNSALNTVVCIILHDNRYSKNYPYTAFLIHPSGFLIMTPHDFPYKTMKITQPPFDGKVLNSVSRIPQLNLVIVKANPSKPVSYVNFENSSSLNVASRLFSVSHLFNIALIRRGYFVSRQPDLNQTIETNNSLTLDIQLENGAQGSPVFNQHGRVIGIINSFRIDGRLTLPVAIPTEEFLPVFQKIANTVTLYGIKLDMETQEVDGKDELIVSAIGKQSVLTQFDIKAGDKITKLGEWKIKCETDFWLSQLAWCMEHYNTPVPITLTRKDIETPLTVKIPWTEEKLQGESNPPENLKRGLQITVVKKDTEDILFSGRTESLTGPGITPNTKCELTGFLKIFREGTYAFHLGVPGTGTLKIGEQFVVEKDKKHPKMRVTGRGFFTQGLYRFSLTLNIHETVIEPFVMVETPLDFIESNLPSPLSDDWIFCEDK